MPHDLKVDLAAGLGIEEDRVCVHPILVGGDFGGKGAPYDEQLCYFLSMATGRPVKIVRSYSEELTATATRHKVVMRLKSGVKRDGTLLATHMQVIADAGAYGGYLSRPNLSGASRVWSTYGVPNFAVDSYRVYTNNVPGGQVRAPGNPQGAFAMESHMDSIARTLGMDPVELRMRNLPGDDEETAVGVRFPDPKGKETLQAAAEAAALHGPKPPHVGRGIAIAQRPQSGGGEASAELTLTPDGEVLIGSAIFSQGTASTTVLQQIVAEAMGVPIESTSVLVKDTDSIAYDNGLRGSGMTRKISGVGHALTQAVQTELLNLAGSVLEWPRAATVFAAPYLVREDTGSQMHWSEVLGRARSTITKQVTYKDEGHTAHFIAQVAEVRVDPDTGQVDLLKMTTAHDVGQVIDPIGHQGQVNGGVIQGVGYAMMEEVAVEQGRVLTPSLADYKVPAITDIPALQTVLVDSGQGGGPYKVKGIGEGPVIPTAAAIANAVEDAVGVRVRDLPITAEKVYDLLRRGQEAAPSRRANPRES
jgi:carbon-monoxide dehydrogenase large subunit